MRPEDVSKTAWVVAAAFYLPVIYWQKLKRKVTKWLARHTFRR